jgi:cyclophilin family peptidyl-prolyl cis-trans isomerase
VGTEKRERQKANRQLKYEQQAKEVSRQRFTKRLLIGGGAAVALLVFILVLAWLVNRNGDDDDSTSTATTVATASSLPATTAGPSPTADAAGSTTTPGSTTAPAPFAYGTGACPPTTGSPTPVKTFTAAPQQCIDPAKTYTATIATDHGDIVITLDPSKAPGTVNNFVTLARYGYYDGTTIFRSAQGIDIIQGGGNSPSDQFGYTIPDEGANWTYPPGKIAMANTGAPNSGGAQWFITTGPNAAKLDAQGTYTVFGSVTSGLDVAQKIAALATSPTDDSMKEKVVVTKITIAES